MRSRPQRGLSGGGGLSWALSAARAAFAESTRCAARSATRRAPHDGQKPRRLQENATSSFSPHCAEKKGRTKSEVDEIFRWLTGYTQAALEAHLVAGTNFEQFFAVAPRMHPECVLVKRVICGVRIEEIEDPLMLEVRRLDKLVDELAKGKLMEKILRRAGA